MTTFRHAIVSEPGKERVARTPFGGRTLIHATAEDTNGAYGMWETFTPPGRGPAPHMHTRETEAFRIVRGVYRFRCGEQQFEASAGAVIVLPPNIWHSFLNIGDEPGQMFVSVTPGGFERFFLEIEALHADTPEKIARIEAGLGIINQETEALAARAGGVSAQD